MSVKKGHGTEGLDEEESEMTQEAQAGVGGGGKQQEETRGQEVDEEKMEKAGERGGEKRKGDSPRGSRVAKKKTVEEEPSACGKSPSA